MSHSHTIRQARNEERALFAKEIYDVAIAVGLAFHAAYNDDCNAACDHLEKVVADLDRLHKQYRAPLSDDEVTKL